MPVEDSALRPGTALAGGRYTIEEKRDAGGFGVVYAARDVRSGVRVAVKERFWRGHCTRDAQGMVCLTDEKDAEDYARVCAAFAREAQMLRRLGGLEGTARRIDDFEENGTAYIVMEYAEGKPLSDVISAEAWKRKRPDAGRIIRWFLPLMEAVGRMHARGIMHRDVSPENIIVSPKGGLTLVDFGTAAVYERADGARYTTIAKVGYAPYEQYKQEVRQGPWSDVYALCATLYVCITGVVPERADVRMMLDELEKPSALGVRIAPELEAAIMRGLSIRTDARYASVDALIRDVRRGLRRARMRRVGKGLIAALLAAAVGFAAWLAHDLVTDDSSHAGNRIQAEWENPLRVREKGQNQVRAAALDGETNAYLYRFFITENATQGERDDLMRALRKRLDALGTPYAFSMEAGSADCVAVRLAGERLSDFVLATLAGNSLYVTGEQDDELLMLSYSSYKGTSELSVVDAPEGGYALRCAIGGNMSYDTLMESMRERGETTLYLRDADGHAIAEAPLDRMQDGVIDFTSLRFDGAREMNEETRFVADYIDALLNQPPLPYAGSLALSEALDAQGAAMEGASARGGMRLARTPGEQALADVLRGISRDTGYPCYENADGTLFICAGLPVDEALPESAAAVTDAILGGYPLSGQIYNNTVILCLIDEEGDERLRVAMNRRIVWDDEPGCENVISGVLYASPRLEPYAAALDAWWQSLPDVYHGFGVSK